MVVVRSTKNTSDVRISKEAKKGRFFLFFRHTGILNLRVPFYRRPFLMAGLVVGIFVLLIWGGRQLLTKAEVSDFYPATCLGTWVNPLNAQGIPETLGSEENIPFDERNSATFVSSTDRIYCGNFVPQDFEAKGNITSVGLTLVWGIRSTTTVSEASTSTEEAPTSSDVIATTTPEISEPSVFRWFTPLVLAQESTTTIPDATSSPEIIEPIVISLPVEETTTTPTSTQETDESLTTPTSTEEIIVATSTEEIATTSTSEYVVVVSPALLKVSYSLDGENWFELVRVDETNLPNLTVRIPVQTWDDIKNLQISIEGTNEITPIPQILLDGMFVQANYEVPPVLTEVLNQDMSGGGGGNISDDSSIFESDASIIMVPDSVPKSIQSENGTFNAKDTPRFELNLDDLPSFMPSDVAPPAATPSTSTEPTSRLEKNVAGSFFSFFLDLLGFSDNRANAQEAALFEAPSGGNKIPRPTLDNPVVARVFTARGDETDIRPDILVVNRQIQVSVPEPNGYFRPGKYVLKLWVLKNGVIYQTENSFYWGVLALNPNKSIYLPNETTDIGIGVLDDEGTMVCDADVSLEITNQTTGRVDVLSTTNGEIIINSTCSVKARTERPDYETHYKVSGVGMYQMKLTAKTYNGEKTVRDLFEVRNSVAFDVERISATRIYPPVAYEMKINVGANQNYSGLIEEKVPAVFDVFSISDGGHIENRGNEKVIIWDANLNAGDKKIFSYYYLAPNVSPQFYLVGPLKIGGFSEVRQWQIAADATVVTIFLTNTASTTWVVPYDWNNASNTIEVIGGGGGGDGTNNPSTNGVGGGGGGAYAKISNLALIQNGSVTVQVGGGTSGSSGAGATSTDTYFNGSGTICIGQSVCAKGGLGAPVGNFGAGGSVTSSLGTTKYAGGDGGIGNTTGDSSGGGGGAAGPHGTGMKAGNGIARGGGGGGGGNGGGTNGATSTTGVGGNGGNGFIGSGGGIGTNSAGGNATSTTGGGGGGGMTSGGAGATSTEWVTAGYGPGGGGGGGLTLTGGRGGLYGGGGGGDEGTGGIGAQGLIVIRYTPLTTTVTATGTQIVSVATPSSSVYIGGAFVLLPDATTTITSITIAEDGTVDATTGLNNILLRYDVDNTAPYDCASVSYAAGDSQFGATDTDGFSSTNGTSTFTGQVYVSSTQAMCVYTELDVTASATNGQTIDIYISASSSISTGAGGAVTGTFPLAITSSTTVTVSNSAPTVSNVVLNAGLVITLIENTTKNVSVAATSTDTDGNADIAYATATIYRSGVGSGCSVDGNNCYAVASTSCTKSSCSGNNCNFSCTAAIQYFAQPTDSGTYSAETWQASVTVRDTAGATGVSTTASGVELNTLLALNVTGSIGYGSLAASSTTGAVNQTTTVTNTGNTTIDVNLSGTDMAFGENIISVGNQKYATSSFTYSSCTICTLLTSSPVQYILNILKPTTTTAVTKDVLWGLSVGFKPAGTYSGTNTFEAVLH